MRHHSQYYEQEQDLVEPRPPPLKERKHSPHCRRHEQHQHRRHRRQQEQQLQHEEEEGVEYDGGVGYQVPQSGLYSVDVEYGYNYTRVGRSMLASLDLESLTNCWLDWNKCC